MSGVHEIGMEKLTDIDFRSSMKFTGSRTQLKEWKRVFYEQDIVRDPLNFFNEVILKVSKFSIRTGSLR